MPMIICDFFGMRNHVENKCMVRDQSFHPPIICHRVAQYNAKHGSTPKLELIDWKPNPLIDHNFHQHESHPGRTNNNRTEKIPTEQQ